MGFEESMIEDGFHDEEEYLEHLMDEADRELEYPQYEQSSYQDECEDEYYYEEEDDDEYYCCLRKQFVKWAKENPLKTKIFYAWLYFDTEEDYNDNDYLDKFVQWQKYEDEEITHLKDYYQEYYPRIIKYFVWCIENPIEEILRTHEIEYLRPTNEYPYVESIPYRELLIDEMEDFENWVANKKSYEQWLTTASDKEKNDLFAIVNENDFQNDTSNEHVRECLLNHFGEDSVLDFQKKRVMSWFDEDMERGKNLYYTIQCIENYIAAEL